ncbi:MAG: ABC transporter ATP-binding protein [Anaerolineaceae bacterium]|nr:ABC transporter ATP-binding protein [Anaerolineaceae bacterium]
MLKVQSLSAAYDKKIILENISFSLPSGNILALVGPNGAGKTTLIRCISGILPLTGGQILLDKLNLADLNPIERARKISVVPQSIHLPPHFTAWETVLFGRTPHLNWLGKTSLKDQKIARQAMQRTKTDQFEKSYVGELSGGEQQRILLARALAQDTPVLLLDEATAHMDLQHQVTLMEHIRDLAKKENLSIIISIHDLNLAARYADQVLLLVNGKKMAVGNPQEVLDTQLLSDIYQTPLKVIKNGSNTPPYIVPVGNNG